MKRSYLIITILLFMPLLLAPGKSYAAEVEIGEIYIDQTTNPSFWAIEGSVRNLETHPIKGYVKIKFLNTEGHIRKSVSTAVNDAKPFEASEVGAFVYRTFRSYFGGIAGFQVIFVEVEIKEPQEPLSPVLR